MPCDAYRKEGYWSDRLITDFFEDALERSPGKVAVKDDRFGALTYGELASKVARLAAALEARGVEKGDRFVIAMPNWQHVPVLVLALTYIGAICVHMPVTGREHEFSGVLGITEAKGIVVPEKFAGTDYVSLIGGIAARFDSLEILVAVGGERREPGWVSFDRLLSEAPKGGPWPGRRLSPSEVSLLLFTSGSSGDPKGVMHSSNSIGALNTTMAPIYAMGPEEVIFMGAPLGYSAGYAHGLRLALYLGATLVLQESWDAGRALETMAREKATFTLTTPTLLRDLLENESFPVHAGDLALRLIFCGGSYVPGDLLRSARDKLPDTLTSVIWGMTEGIGTACRPDTSPERVVGTDGRPFLGTELRILAEDGTEAPAGAEGDLVMRGPQLFRGYYKRPELNDEVFLPGGWFRTGDVASIDAEGFIKISGRRKDLIIRGGANIVPAEIEELLGGDPRIGQLAVVGMPDERLGERVCACVVPAAGGDNLTLEDIVDIVRRQGLSKQKWPERLELMKALPATSAGKLKRPALRDYVRQKIEAETAET